MSQHFRNKTANVNPSHDFRVKDYFLEPIPPAPPEAEAPDPEVFSVRLFRRSDSRRPPITLLTKTVQEREAWFAAILTAMDNVAPSENAQQGHVLQMTTFLGEKPAECFQCGKTLKGSFFQGYRCLRCQANLHKACIGDCPCIEVQPGAPPVGSPVGGGVMVGGGGFGGGGPLRKVDSVALPTAMAETLERSNSTLSLAAPNAANNNGNSASKLPRQVQELQLTLKREMEEAPLESQSWFAGPLSGRVACDRLEALPVGTFLVRQRANGQVRGTRETRG